MSARPLVTCVALGLACCARSSKPTMVQVAGLEIAVPRGWSVSDEQVPNDGVALAGPFHRSFRPSTSASSWRRRSAPRW